MSKLFTVAGTSRRNGRVRFRFTNDLKNRIPRLEQTGHSEINLVELPRAMTKEEAIAHLESLNFAIPEAIAEAVAEPTEDEIAAVIATLPRRDERGRFMSKTFLREVAVRELRAA
jgi:hypothetical protein